MAAILDIELNDFSNSESLFHCDASHQVSAQFDLLFGRRCCLKNFKMADEGRTMNNRSWHKLTWSSSR